MCSCWLTREFHRIYMIDIQKLEPVKMSFFRDKYKEWAKHLLNS